MLAPIIDRLQTGYIERPFLTPIRELFPEINFPSTSAISSTPPTSTCIQNLVCLNNYFNTCSLDGPVSPRPRRRFHEIERIYTCRFSGCNKAYGALNHLNTHISLKGHGSKRSPREFAALRKALRERELSRRFLELKTLDWLSHMPLQ
ncbi:hypothetical protein L0F63_005630 [Massospora cicadina]|nr:hypothetical protein L0F63_005630 [Massospora cicadina]